MKSLSTPLRCHSFPPNSYVVITYAYSIVFNAFYVDDIILCVPSCSFLCSMMCFWVLTMWLHLCTAFLWDMLQYHLLRLISEFIHFLIDGYLVGFHFQLVQAVLSEYFYADFLLGCVQSHLDFFLVIQDCVELIFMTTACRLQWFCSVQSLLLPLTHRDCFLWIWFLCVISCLGFSASWNQI